MSVAVTVAEEDPFPTRAHPSRGGVAKPRAGAQPDSLVTEGRERRGVAPPGPGSLPRKGTTMSTGAPKVSTLTWQATGQGTGLPARLPKEGRSKAPREPRVFDRRSIPAMASGRCGSVPRFAVVLALTCMAVLPLVATRAAAQVPGGFVELATSVNVRPLLTATQIQAFLPSRGLFTFPAP